MLEIQDLFYAFGLGAAAMTLSRVSTLLGVAFCFASYALFAYAVPFGSLGTAAIAVCRRIVPLAIGACQLVGAAAGACVDAVVAPPARPPTVAELAAAAFPEPALVPPPADDDANQLAQQPDASFEPTQQPDASSDAPLDHAAPAPQAAVETKAAAPPHGGKRRGKGRQS
jgi:hypothetical protein